MNRKIKNLIFLISDVLFFIGAWILSFVILRKDVIGALSSGWYYLVVGTLLVVGLNFIFKIYSILLHYAGFSDALRIVCVTIIMGLYNALVSAIVPEEYVKEWAIILTALLLCYMMLTRFFIRFYTALSFERKRNSLSHNEKRVMIVGAGSAGSMLINEMKGSDRYNMRPVCVIDDDKNKLHKYINGVRIVGDTTRIEEMANNYAVDQIIIAIPSAKKADVNRIVAECQKTKCNSTFIGKAMTLKMMI